MARKSKNETAGSEKTRKTKTTGKPAAVKTKKATTTRKKVDTGRIEPRSTPVGEKTFDPTIDQISMRAYFISERRRRFDLPGDANSDWLEAKRQLLAETRN